MPEGARLGPWGEAFVAAELTARGFTIVARNLRVAGVELDLVARRGRRYVIVEVKTRRATVRAEEALAFEQRTRLLRASARIAPLLDPAPRSVRLLVAAVAVDDEARATLRFFEVSAAGGSELP